MESYLGPVVGLAKVAQVSQADPDPQESTVVAVKTQQEAMMEMMAQLAQRMDQLESPGEINEDQEPGRGGSRSRGSTTPRSSTVVCYNCGQVSTSAVDVQHPTSRDTGSPWRKWPHAGGPCQGQPP